MVWLRVDDKFPRHPKIRVLSLKARWFYIEALCYCSEFLTDGFLPEKEARRISGRSERALRELSEYLWTPVDGGYLIHDFLEYNPSKQQVLQRKQDNARRQAVHRKRAIVTRESQRPDPVPSSLLFSLDTVEVDKKRREETPPPPPAGGAVTARPNGTGPGEILMLWNQYAPRCRPARKLNPKRAKAAAVVLKDHTRAEIIEAIKAVNASDFCTGHGSRGWVADLDFLLRPGNVDRLLEGAFHQAQAESGAQQWLRRRQEIRKQREG